MKLDAVLSLAFKDQCAGTEMQFGFNRSSGEDFIRNHCVSDGVLKLTPNHAQKMCYSRFNNTIHFAYKNISNKNLYIRPEWIVAIRHSAKSCATFQNCSGTNDTSARRSIITKQINKLSHNTVIILFRYYFSFTNSGLEALIARRGASLCGYWFVVCLCSTYTDTLSNFVNRFRIYLVLCGFRFNYPAGGVLMTILQHQQSVNENRILSGNLIVALSEDIQGYEQLRFASL